MQSNRLKGRLMAQIGKFRQFVDSYCSELDEVRKRAMPKLSDIEFFELETGGKWYLDVLRGRRVVGVDGSQIMPLKEVGIPVGAVQVAKVFVVHGKGDHDVDYYSEFVPMEGNVDLKRFQMEAEVLMEEMDGRSWLFFDGSFIPTFSAELSEDLKKKYLNAMLTLVRKSEETRTPLIGYVDRSYAKDLARTLGFDVYDTFLLSEMKPMTYTAPLLSPRRDVGDICYAYMRITPSLPVRIEYPAWMKDEGLHHEVIRVVAAECMLGSTRGYPYILERAHARAVISNEERMYFMKVIGSRGVSFKWMSKVRKVG
ncbi:DNA double-strand break repair nuclease NurA [Archaeoglobus veneficus]|uniref:NurA domain-containing protein n=1 Tax=Archaeoglobus veneficus (strain DSM 11195 / SNP6) TaxID=693661 RepID=F2KR67_ARCVS|nr:DNA double-strand break repair nuclease NurA [Archaeoglobus veneficus]AEA46704.1 NurA domain-containing protein [Archaeoglobus veneficus SNP6]